MLSIDPGSSTPPFEQLRQQITVQVGTGDLVPGDRLPTVRRLADDLGIAPNTVARAYRELELAGVLVGRGRAGTFVADDNENQAAKAAARAYADTVRSLGLDAAEALSLVQRALKG
ncbi:GntR family transcriptional regulator [Tessaracoccus antarcticus]|uniref:GntR family transcriptional regulator n=1 Tax=Tessaracoccus antarcticus TaxID=2479848 RepID=A0A3M0GIF1_9ACTN|nr:GntR family transcriptional regulator [Tessaracoccus antarcticus]RMB62392.1 GntR family transcriptional regulator [Tessaracoccus antarcticus]